MLRPKKMKKVRIIITKSKVQDLIKDLHQAGVIDISTSRHEGLNEGKALSNFDTVSTALLKLRFIRSVISKYDPKVMNSQSSIEVNGEQALKEAADLDVDSKLREYEENINKETDVVKNLETNLTTARKLSELGNIDFGRLETRTITYRIGEIQASSAKKVKDKISSNVPNADIIIGNGAQKTTILVLFNREASSKVDAILSENAFASISLPNGFRSPSTTISEIEAKIRDSRERIKSTKAKLLEVAQKYGPRINALIGAIEIEGDRASITSKFAESKYLHLVEGWIVASELPKLQSIVAKYGNAAHSEDLEVDLHHELPPTVLDNPGEAKPFEFITKSYSFPNYNEIDPTLTYFIWLPILYGMIVGDVLYGVFSILFSLYIIKKFKNSEMMSSVGKIWLTCGIPTLLFGVIFDEWSGMSHFHLAEFVTKWTGIEILSKPLYTGFHRMEGLPELLLATLFVAFLHLACAFVVGAVNEWNHNKRHAMAKISWLVLEIGIVAIFLSQIKDIYPEIFAFVEPQLYSGIGAAFAGIGVIAIAMTEGMMGIVELPGFIGNILSYVRIGVIGVVGVILAEIINTYIKPSPEQGVMLIVTIPVFLMLHAANCILAMFEALVQGGRLNIVEFRSKFFHGGGKTFTPFSNRRRDKE